VLSLAPAANWLNQDRPCPAPAAPQLGGWEAGIMNETASRR
jgi:hypothetical protein